VRTTGSSAAGAAVVLEEEDMMAKEESWSCVVCQWTTQSRGGLVKHTCLDGEVVGKESSFRRHPHGDEEDGDEEQEARQRTIRQTANRRRNCSRHTERTNA
jgi:hypothetical protein